MSDIAEINVVVLVRSISLQAGTLAVTHHEFSDYADARSFMFRDAVNADSRPTIREKDTGLIATYNGSSRIYEVTYLI